MLNFMVGGMRVVAVAGFWLMLVTSCGAGVKSVPGGKRIIWLVSTVLNVPTPALDEYD